MIASGTRNQYPIAPVPALALLCLVAAAVLAGCGNTTDDPEAAVRAWVERGKRLATDKDRRGLVAMISPRYTDARGNGRDDIEAMFRLYFLRQHRVALLTRIEEVRLYGDSAAEVLLTVGMAGTNDGVLGFSADAYRFDLELERAGNDWLLIAARWAELGKDLR